VTEEKQKMSATPPDPAPVTTTTSVAVPMPTTVAELRQSDLGDIVGVPRAPATGNLGVPSGTPVALVAVDFFKSPTVKIALSIMAGAFAFFLGYVADQVLQTKFLGPMPWYLDVLIVGGVGAALIALVAFWHADIVVKVRKATIGGLMAFFGFVGYTITVNNGLDGIDWQKTFHAGVNVAVVGALGGILLLSKVFFNNPITNLPWTKDAPK
jgi:hypothetical protein